jgi:hypothetical protein
VTGFTVIPSFTFGPSQSTAPTAGVNATATPVADQQLTLAAIDKPLRFGYGRARLGADVAVVVAWGSSIVVLSVHGRGVYDAVEAVEFDNAPAPAGVQATHYLGTPGQGVDPWLAAAFAARGVSYTDTLPGIAYSVLLIPAGVETAFENIAFVVRQRKVYDPRTTTTAYSDNPALALANFITDPADGRGETIDWASVEACADLDDELVGGEKRRTLSLVLTEPRSVDEWERTLETYAGCWVVREGGAVYLVPDAPAAASFHFTKAKQRVNTVEVEVRNRAKSPTVVTVRYTDTSVTPWAQASATVKIAGVDAGTLPYQESPVDLPGIISHGHALREAYRRLYEAQLCDVSVNFTALDEGIKVRRYDVIELSDDEGFTAKPFRVVDASIAEPGRWRIRAVEYQEGVYSNATASPPTIDDTDLPNPNAPPAPASVAAVEELFQFQSFGQYGSRLKITVTPATFAFPLHFTVEVKAGTETVYVVDVPHASPAVVRTPALQEGVAYTVSAVTVSTTGARSAPTSTGVTMLGKALPPGDVPRFDGFEIAGEVLLNWDQVVDIDKVRYEIRSGSTSSTWDTAGVVAVIDSTRTSIKGLAAGVTRFWIKAIDSVGGYSSNALYKDVTITSDAGAFVLSDYKFTAFTGTGVTEFRPANPHHEKWFHLSNGYATTFNALFGSALDTYTDPLLSYQSSGATEVEGVTNAFDFGTTVSGNVTVTGDLVVLDGAYRILIGLSLDGSAYTWHEGLSVKQAFRFVKVKLAVTGDAVVRGLPSIRIDIVAREESGQVTTLSPTGGKLVELANAYFAAQNIQLTPLGSTAAMALVDDVQLSPVAARALRMRTTHAFVTSSWTYLEIAAPSYTLQSGDYLEFDVFLDPANPTTSQAAGIDMEFTTAGSLRANTCTDVVSGQQVTGAGDFGAAAKGQWLAIKAAIPAGLYGKVVNTVMAVCEADVSGTFNAFYRNVRITDGAGAVRLTIWTSGAPTEVVKYTAEASSYSVKPMNTFRAYAFTDAGAQSAKDVRWQFKGV